MIYSDQKLTEEL